MATTVKEVKDPILIGDEDLTAVESGAYEGVPSDIYYFIGGLVERSQIDAAVSHVTRLTERGYLEAYGALAEFVYDKNGARPDEARWLEFMCLYANSGRPGNAKATFRIGELFEQKDEDEEAFKWFLQAAEKGYEEAAILVGYFYIEGTGIAKNILEGARWFVRSLQMEPRDWEVLQEDWPIDRESGWKDWALYGEMCKELSLEGRFELARIVDKQAKTIK